MCIKIHVYIYIYVCTCVYVDAYACTYIYIYMYTRIFETTPVTFLVLVDFCNPLLPFNPPGRPAALRTSRPHAPGFRV